MWGAASQTWVAMSPSPSSPLTSRTSTLLLGGVPVALASIILVVIVLAVSSQPVTGHSHLVQAFRSALITLVVAGVLVATVLFGALAFLAAVLVSIRLGRRGTRPENADASRLRYTEGPYADLILH